MPQSLEQAPLQSLLAEGLAWDVAHHQQKKYGEILPGDVFLAQQVVGEERMLTVLADGLGSGVKANVLAGLTATMALRYAAARRDVVQFARTLLRTLPVCQVRGISYSTFTICEMNADGSVCIADYGNPDVLHVHDGVATPVQGDIIEGKGTPGRTLRQATLQMAPGDYLVFCSDGITQAGMGKPQTPMGWGPAQVQQAVEQGARGQPPARILARTLVQRASYLDDQLPKDDITCGVVSLRKQRCLQVFSGPPYDQGRDVEMARRFREWEGLNLICGGTTADIIARECDETVGFAKPNAADGIPPFSFLEGAELVTEGVITLQAVLNVLQGDEAWNGLGKDPLGQLCSLLVDSDSIHFVLGAGVNHAHHNPQFPAHLRDRRRLIEDLARVLEDRYCKRVHIELW